MSQKDKVGYRRAWAVVLLGGIVASLLTSRAYEHQLRFAQDYGYVECRVVDVLNGRSSTADLECPPPLPKKINLSGRVTYGDKSTVVYFSKSNPHIYDSSPPKEGDVLQSRSVAFFVVGGLFLLACAAVQVMWLAHVDDLKWLGDAEEIVAKVVDFKAEEIGRVLVNQVRVEYEFGGKSYSEWTPVGKTPASDYFEKRQMAILVLRSDPAQFRPAKVTSSAAKV